MTPDFLKATIHFMLHHDRESKQTHFQRQKVENILLLTIVWVGFF